MPSDRMMYVSLGHTTKIILCQIMETITLGESTWEPETQHAAQLNLLSPPPTPAVAKLREQGRRSEAKRGRKHIP